jgi:hypothetical protein
VPIQGLPDDAWFYAPTLPRPTGPRVKITRTTALYPSAVFIQWDVDSEESGSFYVDVARSGSPQGPWESLASGLLDAYNFLDDKFNLPPAKDARAGRDGLNLFSLSRALYYQVTVTPPSGASNKFCSQPTPVEPGLNFVNRMLKRKILHDQGVGYARVNGVQLVVLKRRRWGNRCPECYDPVTMQATREHCLRCFGTSYDHGYWNPVLIRGRREAAAVETNIASEGDREQKLADFNILDYPLIDHKDLIIEIGRDDRYQVLRAHSTELNSVPVTQKLSTTLLSRSSIEYQILVDPVNVPPLY